MSELVFEEIPSLDLVDFASGSESKKNASVKQLGEAYTHSGVVSGGNQGLSGALAERFYTSVQIFLTSQDGRSPKRTNTYVSFFSFIFYASCFRGGPYLFRQLYA